MTLLHPAPSFYIGWDVGGWNCDKNGKSRDAIVILDGGACRSSANHGAETSAPLSTPLPGLRLSYIRCLPCAMRPIPGRRVTLAIDTPLGFPQAFAGLVTGLHCVEPIADSASNPYLFRRTERILFEHGLNTLSAVKDMIGSQATKGMHALAKFAPHRRKLRRLDRQPPSGGHRSLPSGLQNVPNYGNAAPGLPRAGP